MNKKNVNSVTVIYLFIIVFILFLSVGWSAFNEKIGINDLAATVRPTEDIRITGISVSDSYSNASVDWTDYNKRNVQTLLQMPNEDATVTLKVKITNIGSTKMGILSITGLRENLEYELLDYQLKEKLCEDHRCNLGVEKYISIKIRYKEGSFNQEETSFPIRLDFDFRPIYEVNYTGFDADTSFLPQEVMEKDTLEVDFSDIEMKTVSVTQANVLLLKKEYYFENKLLRIENVKGNINISAAETLYELLVSSNLGTDAEINFQDPNIENGIFMNEETKNDEYPIYYYRGMVNNSAIYANHCWKVVRTTETGGVKLVYDGKVSDTGTCVSDHDYLGSEIFNDKINFNGVRLPSPSQVGFKYEEVRPIQLLVPANGKDTEGILSLGTVFGHDVRYDSSVGKYFLVETIANENFDDLEDQIRGGSYNIGYHYTCLTTSDSCETVYYIYYNNFGENAADEWASGLYGITLSDGLNVTETLEKTLYHSSNKIDSHVKEYLEEFFIGEGSDFERSKGDALINHIDELDDVQWCNDRTIAGYHGWDVSADNHSSHNKYLHFAAFKRLVGEEGLPATRPDVYCDIKNDAFTVTNDKGNQQLTYPIAMLTADEAVLAGAVYEQATANYLNMRANATQFFMTPYYISDDHTRMFTISSEDYLDSGYASTAYAIRPAIALKSGAIIKSGDGTSENPYQIAFN